MEGLLAVAGHGNLDGCKAAMRELLAPALVAEVSALVAAGAGNAAPALACIQYFLQCGACLDARKEEGGETVLIIAVKAGRLDAVEVMRAHWSSAVADGGGIGAG